jgi:hypothetical protein
MVSENPGPKPLSSYRLYKEDAEYIIGWLGKKALVCGYYTNASNGSLEAEAGNQASSAGGNHPAPTYTSRWPVLLPSVISRLRSTKSLLCKAPPGEF